MFRVVFEFIGGPNDGKIVDGWLEEGGDSQRYYLFSDHGRIGQRFKVASDLAVETLARERLRLDKRHHFQRHYYVVADRFEDGDELWIRAEYVPPGAP